MIDLMSFQHSRFNQYFKDEPIGFLDIGARGGSHTLVEPLHTHVSFLGFEPDREECDALNNNDTLKHYWNGFEVLPHALSNAHAARTLHHISSPTNTSLLKPNPRFVDRYAMHQKWSVVGQSELDTSPLDHVIYDLKRGFSQSGEIIKVDTQGTELEILKGAEKLLTQRTVCVVAEVEFFAMYQDQKLFSDMELYLRSQGFSFYGFLTQHTRSKKSLNKKTHHGRERLFYADAVFFKDPFSVDLHLNQRQYAVLLFAAILTQYFDFALEIAAAKPLSLSQDDYAHIEKLILTLSHVDPIATHGQLTELVNKLENNTASANLYLGKYIDQINFPDFEDCAES